MFVFAVKFLTHAPHRAARTHPNSMKACHWPTGSDALVKFDGFIALNGRLRTLAVKVEMLCNQKPACLSFPY